MKFVNESNTGMEQAESLIV